MADLFLDLSRGVSGDMFAAALIDLGADVKELERVLASLKLKGYALEISRKEKEQISMCDFKVKLDIDNHDSDMDYLYGHLLEHGPEEHEHPHEHPHLHEHPHPEAPEGPHHHAHAHPHPHDHEHPHHPLPPHEHPHGHHGPHHGPHLERPELGLRPLPTHESSLLLSPWSAPNAEALPALLQEAAEHDGPHGHGHHHHTHPEGPEHEHGHHCCGHHHHHEADGPEHEHGHHCCGHHHHEEAGPEHEHGHHCCGHHHHHHEGPEHSDVHEHKHCCGHHHKHEHGRGHSHEGQRNLSDVLRIIKSSDASTNAKVLATKIFRIIAEAEAKAHQTTVQEVHFHEVGALDSIVDVLSAAVLFDSLKVDKCYATPLTEGTGTVRCAHGILPVPVPAVCNIVDSCDLPMERCEVEGELVTPTGAAIVAALEPEFIMPEGAKLIKSGFGAGKREYSRPSFVKASLLESA